MNTLKLPGQLIGHIRAKFQERTISFKKILTLDLHRPPFQIDLDDDKIEGMMKSFKKNRDFLMFKNKVVIGVIVTKFSTFDTNYKMYVIDGQHRIEMAKRLALEEDENDSLTFCYYETNSDKEMKKLFIEINKDSFKNAKYIGLDDFKQNIHDELKNYLYAEKSLFFAPKKKETNKLITISEFLDKLTTKNYFEKFTLLKQIIQDLESKNKIFYKSIDYKEYLIEDPNYFYMDERSSISEGFIAGLKNNNFLDFLCDNSVPDHKFKKQKDVISPKLRILVWTRWYGEQPSGPCPLCKETIKIGKNGFHCGHITSEANGGLTILENLRPLCGTCNTKMNAMNWMDYEKKIENKN